MVAAFARIENVWKEGDKVVLKLPMDLNAREWVLNKNSVTVQYGPLSFSLLIKEDYVQTDSRASAQGDAKWQEGADPRKWPSFEIHPGSEWNYGLAAGPEKFIKVISSGEEALAC